MSNENLKLRIELVPRTAWVTSLSKQLTKSRWRKLREIVLEGKGTRCQICGDDEGPATCHEEWEFHNETGEQILVGFSPICRKCHFVVHFGSTQLLARQHGWNLEDFIDHFCKVNQVDRAKFQAHKKEAFRIYRERSEREWRIEYGEYADLLAAMGLETGGDPRKSPWQPKVRIKRPKKTD